MSKVGKAIVRGTVGLVTGGIGGMVRGAASAWDPSAPSVLDRLTGKTAAPVPEPPRESAVRARTGATRGGPSAPGLGMGGAGLPHMRGSGYGAMGRGAMAGASSGAFYGPPGAGPPGRGTRPGYRRRRRRRPRRSSRGAGTYRRRY